MLLLTLAAAWTTGSRARRAVGVGIALTAGLPPWLMPSQPLFRALVALVAVAGTMRVIDLLRGEWSLRERLVHAASLIDTRRLVRAAPRLDRRGLLEAIAALAVMLAAHALLRIPVARGSAMFWIARWGSCLVLVYAAVVALYCVIEAVYAAIGFATPPLHVAPVMSRSVQELWGERWARPISTWLGETFFRPYARRRRPLAGALAAFVASATFHAYAIWVALGLVPGLAMAASMFGYFVMQAVIMAVERALGVRGWTPLAGHVWTVTLMVATSPLFLEPSVRVLGLPAP